MTPEAIRSALQSDNLGDRLRAVNDIRTLPAAEGLTLVELAAADQNPRVRYAAISQLDSCGTADRDRAAVLLRDRLSHDSEADVQAAAADALGALKCADAFDDLAAVYGTTDEWLLRFSIISALGELGDGRAVDLLAGALASDVELEQLAAIGSLGELKDDRAIALLLPFVDRDDWQVRHRTARALGFFATDDRARAALETLANDAIEQVADEANNSLNAA